MFRRILAGLVGLAATAALAATPAIARISALADGRLLMNDRPAGLADVEGEFRRLQAIQGGAVWYYRERPEQEPSRQAMEVIELVVRYRLPISMSSKPDFTDFIDPDGRSRRRGR